MIFLCKMLNCGVKSLDLMFRCCVATKSTKSTTTKTKMRTHIRNFGFLVCKILKWKKIKQKYNLATKQSIRKRNFSVLV